MTYTNNTTKFAALPIAQLVEIYNQVTTGKPVRKFESKTVALSRTAAALEKDGAVVEFAADGAWEIATRVADEATGSEGQAIDPVTGADIEPLDLTDNEMAAALLLVRECLAGMGGSRPADLEHDEYTWIDIDVLVANGWTRESAAGTFSSLDAKGVISEYEPGQMVLATRAWKFLDTVWDDRARFATASTAPAKKSRKTTTRRAPSARAEHPETAKITVLVANPKRAGSNAHARFALYRTGMTVGEYLDKCEALQGESRYIYRSDLRWDTARDFIKIG